MDNFLAETLDLHLRQGLALEHVGDLSVEIAIIKTSGLHV